jgi:adenine phosphoribosyltransferase
MEGKNSSRNDRYHDVIIRLNSVRMLRSLKNFLKYNEMEKIFGIPKSILSRYISGSVLPSKDKAEIIYEQCISKGLIKEIINKNNLNNNGVYNPSSIYLFSSLILNHCYNLDVNKVIVFFPNDIFLGFLVALELNSQLVFAYNEKYFPSEKRIEYTYSLKLNNPFEYEIKNTIAILKNSLKKFDKVLITGLSLSRMVEYLALVSLIKKLKFVEIAGIIIVFSENKKYVKEFQDRLNQILPNIYFKTIL